MPSTKENNFKGTTVEVKLNDVSYIINVYDTSLGSRWLEALSDNLKNKRTLEKNFCFLGFADSKRDIRHLVKELNKNIKIINKFDFEPSYERIELFSQDDFQFSSKNGFRLKHGGCNLLHR